MLRGSGRHRARVATPGHVTSVGFLREVLEEGAVGADGVPGRERVSFPVLCGGLEGRVYRFHVRLAPSRPGAAGDRGEGLRPPEAVLTRCVESALDAGRD